MHKKTSWVKFWALLQFLTNFYSTINLYKDVPGNGEFDENEGRMCRSRINYHKQQNLHFLMYFILQLNCHLFTKEMPVVPSSCPPAVNNG